MQEPDWTAEPTTQATAKTLTLRRVGLGALKGICLSARPMGCEVHFWRGRTRPHTPNGTCEACQDGQSSRWRGYVAMLDPTTREVFLAELTGVAYEGIKEGIECFGTLRGHWIKLERTRPKNTAPVRAYVHSNVEPENKLPAEPDIKEQMYRIWDLNEQAQPAAVKTETRLSHLKIGEYHKGNGEKLTEAELGTTF